ncbi:BRD4-interacting chromatin-remodeling complex-associated protein-like [Brienomyrus brachyistius]|uniref:BRD4-interacting chromatin-remodeling complex-associated protein-like n=1 Tax=Brienomyrus brachyistius TaxID=42636 RepID=UPI0020B3E561|nr:BRD4-interacting chromatin-remodeling complex-associated protein-like [Brienomyrus brachyistius]XP_048843347.1 BRD4-interacting chromatin-remodeling complex-associated protein-like [Brienomyrus brachyistius]XP_048843348.1 BRD4-interacting chromatin-remodeling complex-associated protein-like [Brienomyrus brachyistius]XP_048843349.1 BRD4-interacting chromatin-remodeling complex-associated protein-like [Brienomyrus brachyistius]
MDDEDDHLLDIIGDAHALDSYLHGSSSKLGDLDIKEDGSPLGMADGAELHDSSTLQFIDDLGGASPSGAELGDEQPFDILQKSLLEADITEQTLAQEALLESSAGPTAFPQMSASGGRFEGVAGAGLSFPGGIQPQTFVQQSLHNGSLPGQVQLLGAFDSTSSVMTTPPGGGVQGAVFTPTPLGTSTPLQNIIIQRGPPAQAVVRPIQPRPLSAGGQTVYSLGVQLPGPVCSPQPDHKAKVVSHAGSIVIQQPQSQQPGLSAGQILTLTSAPSVLNGPALQTANLAGAGPAYSILTNQSGTAVQLVAGQGFSGGGQLIVNQGLIGGQVPQAAPAVVQVAQALGATSKSWAPSLTSAPGPTQGTLVTSAGAAPCDYANQLAGGGAPVLQAQQQVSVNLEQHFLVPLAQGATSSIHMGAPEQSIEMQAFVVVQDSSSAVEQGFQQAVKAGKPSHATSQVELQTTQPIFRETSVPQPLSKGDLVLQRLQLDQARVLSADTSPFTSPEDAVRRLLPYHVLQGALSSDADLLKVDMEFESAACSVLNRTREMLSKYRHLLLVEAERTSPSSETVMICRTFNQEESQELTQDKRLALVDPEGFLEDFCCVPKPAAFPSPLHRAELAGEVSPAVRNSPDMNASPESSFSVCDDEYSSFQTSLQYHSEFSAPLQGRGLERPLPFEQSRSPLADADSVLEAAVNSILEC